MCKWIKYYLNYRRWRKATELERRFVETAVYHGQYNEAIAIRGLIMKARERHGLPPILK